jgi:cytochrome c553
MRFLSVFSCFMALVYASVTCAAEGPAAPKADLERGKQIASTVCVACHGADGNSVVPTNPVLAGQHADYIALQLKAFKSGTRQSPIMQGMAASLTPEDMLSVGTYFEMQKPAGRAATDKALVARGQEIWRGGIKQVGVPPCAGCHGAAGHGLAGPYPRVAGQFPDLTFGWLKAYAAGTRTHPVMSAVASRLNENDMKAVAEYTAGLR